MLDFIEHSLDQIALFTKVFVKISGFFAIGSGRNDNLGPHNFCRITSLVCQDSLDFQPLQKHQSLCVIQHLTPCQNESKPAIVMGRSPNITFFPRQTTLDSFPWSLSKMD
jgi:hypothetical protein